MNFWKIAVRSPVQKIIQNGKIIWRKRNKNHSSLAQAVVLKYSNTTYKEFIFWLGTYTFYFIRFVKLWEMAIGPLNEKKTWLVPMHSTM